MVFFLYLFVLLRLFEKHPESITISLVGFPKSGKTVFITVFFYEFIQQKFNLLKFRSYGEETTEEITTNYTKLERGEWLDPTKPYVVYQYRGIALLNTSPFSSQEYKILIEDFAGEFTNSFKDKEINPAWLHKSPYFKNISTSDIILIAIDCNDIHELYTIKDNELNGKIREKINDLESIFINALNRIIEDTDVKISKKLKTPVALVFMKFDLLYDLFEKNNNENAYSRSKDMANSPYKTLIKYCEENCSNFEIFYVSSVGHVTEDGKPLRTIVPYHIVDPIIWGLTKI
jgi:hypothetical protein